MDDWFADKPYTTIKETTFPHHFFFTIAPNYRLYTTTTSSYL
jgi:hypothetical protein